MSKELMHSTMWKCLVKTVRECRRAEPGERLELASKIADRYYKRNPRLSERVAMTALRIVAWIENYDDN